MFARKRADVARLFYLPMLQLHDIPAGREALLLGMGALLIIIQGWKHGLYYARLDNGLRRQAHPFFRHPFSGIHEADWLFAKLLYALLFLAGCDLIRIIAMQMVAHAPFQILINWAYGWPAFTHLEDDHWVVFGRRIPKLLAGPWRPLKALLGLTLCFYEFIINLIW
jgi:hypothetical protein